MDFIFKVAHMSGASVEEVAGTYGKIQKENADIPDSDQIQGSFRASIATQQEGSFNVSDLNRSGTYIWSSTIYNWW